MRGLRSTLALLVVAIGLGIYIYIDADRAPAGTADALETVFDFESDDVSRISILAENGDETVIEKAADRWGLVAPFEGNVDVPAVVGLASSIADLELQRVVAEPEDAVDLSAFGLTPPRITVGVAATTGADGRLLLGERTPTGGDVYATLDGSNRVFLISGYLDDTFNQTTFDLRDKTILDFNSDQVASLVIAGGETAIELHKTDNRWSLASPFEAHADFGVTNGIVGRLSTGRIASVEVERADDLGPFGLDVPRLTVTVGLDSSAATLLIGNDNAGGLVYARDLARDLVFTVDQSLVDELTQGPSEFRRKDLFAFRPFNATRVEIDRADDRWVFEKRTSETEDGSQTWHRTAPSTEDLDTTAMDDLLAKLSNLRANEFVSSQEGTGLDAPAVNVSVTFDDGAQERVAVGRVNDDASGLSRYNYVTARALVGVLQRMHDDPRHKAAYLATLPVAGQSGTLAARMTGTAAEGNVRAKTGSMSNVRALSGYVTSADGEPLAFAVLANNFPGPATPVLRVIDQLVDRLARSTRLDTGR